MALVSVLARKFIRDISRNKLQFGAAILTVFLGVALYSSLVMAMDNLNRSYEYAYDRLNYADFTVYLQPTPISVLDRLKSIDNVDELEGRVSSGIGIYINSSRQIVGLAIGLNTSRRPRVNGVKIEDGRYFHSGEWNVCLVERHLANAYGYHAGDRINLIIRGKIYMFKVVGVVASPEFLILVNEYTGISSGYTYGVVFLPMGQLQELLNMTSLINEILVTVVDRSRIDDTIDRFREILEPYGIIRIVKGEDRPSYKFLKWDLEGFGEISILFPSLILLVAVIEVYSILKRLIISQQKEIGILKALGFSNKRIMLHYMLYAFFVGSIGSISGALFSIFLSAEMTHMYTEALGIPFTIVSVDFSVIFKACLLYTSPSPRDRG